MQTRRQTANVMSTCSAVVQNMHFAFYRHSINDAIINTHSNTKNGQQTNERQRYALVAAMAAATEALANQQLQQIIYSRTPCTAECVCAQAKNQRHKTEFDVQTLWRALALYVCCGKNK